MQLLNLIWKNIYLQNDNASVPSKLVITLTLTLSQGVVGKVQKNLPEEEREGGEKSVHSAPAGATARTQDLLRARQGSPAARLGSCLDKQAFQWL